MTQGSFVSSPTVAKLSRAPGVPLWKSVHPECRMSDIRSSVKPEDIEDTKDAAAMLLPQIGLAREISRVDGSLNLNSKAYSHPEVLLWIAGDSRTYSLLPDLKSLQQRFIVIEIDANPSRALSRACGSSTSFSPRQAAVPVLTQVIVAL